MARQSWRATVLASVAWPVFDGGASLGKPKVRPKSRSAADHAQRELSRASAADCAWTEVEDALARTQG
jgi:hypothetical protein